MLELVWDGKYRDGVRQRGPHPAPLPTLATDELHPAPPRSSEGSSDEPREESSDEPSEGSSDEPRGRLGDGAPNRLILGDGACALPALLDDLRGRVDLVYLDPPFDTGDRFDFLATIPEVPVGTPRVAIPAYDDARGLERWVAWFDGIAAVVHELLADGGSLYLHLDAHVAHYAKAILDEVFGERGFQREIIWRIGWVSGFKSRVRGWIRNHDTILFYAKGGRPKTFHKEYIPYPEGYVRRDGNPPRGLGYPVEDVWNASPVDRLDSIQIVSFSGEKVGYPTQKNEALLARIVRASSDPGDIVLDGFVGSGTTAVVAEHLGRRWVAIDVAPIAVHTTRKRLLSMARSWPFIVQRAVGVGEAAVDGLGASLSVVARIDGRRVTLELTSLAMPDGAAPDAVRARIERWSQWLEGWCVDWEGVDGPLRASTSVWRPLRGGPLLLTAGHLYESPGRRLVRVKAFHALGGSAEASLVADVE